MSLEKAQGYLGLSVCVVIRLLPRRELELKLIETGVLCTELVGGWRRKEKGGGEPELFLF